MRYSVGSALIIQLISSGFSLAIATIVTFWQGISKRIFIRLWDILLSFPTIILAFALISVFGPGLKNVVIALIFAQTIYYSRIFHNAMLSLNEMNYIKAARVSGTTGIKLLKTHFIPHILPTLYTLLSLDLGKVILEIAGFSFIGLGVQAPIPEWGMMIDEGKQYMRQYPAIIIYPGISIFLIVLLLHQVGVKKHARKTFTCKQKKEEFLVLLGKVVVVNQHFVVLLCNNFPPLFNKQMVIFYSISIH
jgi:nickel transport system permease protein